MLYKGDTAGRGQVLQVTILTFLANFKLMPPAKHLRRPRWQQVRHYYGDETVRFGVLDVERIGREMNVVIDMCQSRHVRTVIAYN